MLLNTLKRQLFLNRSNGMFSLMKTNNTALSMNCFSRMQPGPVNMMLFNSMYRDFGSRNKGPKAPTYTEIKTKEEQAEYTKKEFDRADLGGEGADATLRTLPQKKIRFSGFAGGKDKEYPGSTDRSASFDREALKAHGFTDFKPKEEYMRAPFNPNVRTRLPEMPSADLTRRYLHGYAEPDEAQSAYVAVNHGGKTYHLFNAKRMPLGRMATAISEFVRGKHKPGYD